MTSSIIDTIKNSGRIDAADVIDRLNLAPVGGKSGKWQSYTPCPVKGGPHEHKGFRIDTEGNWTCFACDESGDIIHLVAQSVFGNKNCVSESLGWFAAQFQLEYGGDSKRPSGGEGEGIPIKMLQASCDYWSQKMTPALYRMIRTRYGLSREFADGWKIGYADGKGLYQHLLKDFSPKELESSGLFRDASKEEEYFVGRLVIPFWQGRMVIPSKEATQSADRTPIKMDGGRVVYLTGRSLSKEDATAFGIEGVLTPAWELERGQKYKKMRVHSESNPQIFPSYRNDWMMGEMPFANSKSPSPNTLYITEGSIDPLPMIQHGFSALGLSALKISEEVLKKLLKAAKRFERVVMIPDQEESGRGAEGFEWLASKLAEEKIDAYCLELPRDGHSKMDPAAYFALNGASAVASIVGLTNKAQTYGVKLVRAVGENPTSHKIHEHIKKMAPYFKDRSMLELAFYLDDFLDQTGVKGAKAKEIKKQIFSFASAEDVVGNPTEDQLRRQFLNEHPEWKYDPTACAWLRYDGKSWVVCNRQETSKALLAFCDEVLEKTGRARVPNGYTARYIEGVQKQIQWDQTCTDWNQNKRLIPLQNGVLDLDKYDGKALSEIKLQPHNREDFLTWVLPYDFDAKATCPTIDKFLEEVTSVLDDDGYIHLRPQAVDMLLAFMAATVRGMGRELQMFLEIIGPGGSGKGTFAALIRQLIGQGNVFQTILDQLEEDKFVVAGIVGKKLMLVTDSEQHLKKAERLRMITGGDAVPLRKMREQPEDAYQPHCTTLVLSNSHIMPRDPHGALERRRVTVPFYREIQTHDMIGDLQEIFAKELPGLLNKLIQIPEDVIWRRLKTACPALATTRVDLFTSDLFGAFIRDKVVYREGAITMMGGITEANKLESEGRYKYERHDVDLYPAYLENYAKNAPNTQQAMAANTFGKALKTLLQSKLRIGQDVVFERRTGKGMCYHNLAIRTEEDPVDAPTLFDISPVTGNPHLHDPRGGGGGGSGGQTDNIWSGYSYVPPLRRMDYQTLAQFVRAGGRQTLEQTKERERAMAVAAGETPIREWKPIDYGAKPTKHGVHDSQPKHSQKSTPSQRTHVSASNVSPAELTAQAKPQYRPSVEVEIEQELNARNSEQEIARSRQYEIPETEEAAEELAALYYATKHQQSTSDSHAGSMCIDHEDLSLFIEMEREFRTKQYAGNNAKAENNGYLGEEIWTGTAEESHPFEDRQFIAACWDMCGWYSPNDAVSSLARRSIIKHVNSVRTELNSIYDGGYYKDPLNLIPESWAGTQFITGQNSEQTLVSLRQYAQELKFWRGVWDLADEKESQLLKLLDDVISKL